VQDFGIGISTDMQEQVFDRFFRIKNESFKIQQGLGPGLYITAEIIKNHRGTISVTRKKDKGSVFLFYPPGKIFTILTLNKLNYSLMAYDLIK
jgi:signal transduction histidine kinase